MKIAITPKSSEQGTALLVALFLCTILTVTIAGYLKHANQQALLSARSQDWNLAIAVSEAGIEEAMQLINSKNVNLSADGWSVSGTTYTTTRTLAAGASYTVRVNMKSSQFPTITCIATVNGKTFAQNDLPSDGTIFAAVGGNVSLDRSKSIQRAVKVRAGRNGLFMKAMVARHTIDMNGNPVMTDSFDSTSVSNSINGRYPAGIPSMLLDNGDVASNDSIINAVNAGNANIFGHVSVGPGGTIALGPNGAVGSRTWQAANTGIEPGYFTDDMNFTFPSITLPYTSGLTPQQNVTIYTTNYVTVTTSNYPVVVPPSGVVSNLTYTTTSTPPSPAPYGLVTNTLTRATVSSSYPAAGTYVGVPYKKKGSSGWYYDRIIGYNYTFPSYTYTYSMLSDSSVTSTTYDYIIEGGSASLPPVNYYLSSLNINGKVLVRGNARLVVGGDVNMTGTSKLILASDGKLEMYVGGSSINIAGGGVVNPTGYAQNFLLWGADSVTSLALSGNGEFTGIVVAPNANIRLNGGGASGEDFIGAIIGNTIRMNGRYSFHYDEALRNYRNSSRYLITKWDEISVAEAYK